VLLHRDIRWPDVIRSKTNHTKWVLIDWDDASTTPTCAATHMTSNEHAPQVFSDNHGVEVDIWGVGQLITSSTQNLTDAMRDLGQRMMDGEVSTAEQGFGELYSIPEF